MTADEQTMLCPKCGAKQEDGREDCVACGIIFSRWWSARKRTIEAEERAAFASRNEEKRGIPGWVYLVVAFAVLMFGINWTRHARERRERLRSFFDATLHPNKDRTTTTAAPAPEPAPAKVETKLLSSPSAQEELTTEFIVNRLQQCREFGEAMTVLLPKAYDSARSWMVEREYPIEAAVRNGLLVRHEQGGLIQNTLASGTTLQIRDAGDYFELYLGRLVLKTAEFTVDGETATVRFSPRWEYAATARAVDLEEVEGTATFARVGRMWMFRDAALNKKWGYSTARAICQ